MNVTVSLDNETIAQSRDCTISFQQEVVEYNPLPGSIEDDGWAHYRCGNLSWSLSNNGLYVKDSAIEILDEDKTYVTEVYFGSTAKISGNTKLSNISINAQVGSLAKMDMSFECDEFPTLTIL